MKKSNLIKIIVFLLFIGFIIVSNFLDYENGEKTGSAFFTILKEMLKILPCAFILIGLFEVWIKQETVMKHLGEDSGLKGYLWVLLLAGFSVGGLYVAFPLSKTLYEKGASLKIIFVYLGFTGIVRIPMNIFEISFLGVPFTFVRLIVAIPLFLFFGILTGVILNKKGYRPFQVEK